MAAEAVARRAQAAAPHGRAPCVLAVRHGEAPGWTVAPWVVTGACRAYSSAGAALHVQTLGERRAAGGAESVALAWPGVPRALRIPKAWLGRRLCLLAPCVVTTREDRVAPRSGPVAAAFEALALAIGAPSTGDPSGLGARVAAHVFAHVTVIVDASWSMIVDEATHEDRRFATARCLGVAAPSPTADGSAVRPPDLDAWIVRRLGLATPIGSPHLLVEGDDGDGRWVNASAAPRGLACREIAALWRPGASPRSAGAAAGHVDALDRAWAAWTERGP